MATVNIFDMADTWNNVATTYTAIKMNVTDTASNASSLLLDLQVGGTSRLSVNKNGTLTIATTGGTFAFNGSTGFDVGTFSILRAASMSFGPSNDVQIRRRGAANLQLGAGDAASPVAQTLSVQSVVAGTTNTAGANFTIAGSQGTGTGAGGSIIFRVAPAGSSGFNQNALADALTIGSDQTVTFAANSGISLSIAPGGAPILSGGNASYDFGNGASNTANVFARVNNTRVFGIGSTTVIVPTDGSYAFGTVSSLSSDLILARDAANKLALRNGTNAQAFNIYNTYTDASNYERGFVKWDTNVLKIGTEKLGTGTARALEFQTDGTTRLTIADTGAATFSGTITGTILILGTSGAIRLGNINNGNNTRTFWTLDASSDVATFAIGLTSPIMRFSGATSSFPALKRSSTTLQVRLANDSDYAPVQGKLTTETAYTAGAPTATGYIVLYDSTGTAYKVPAEAL